MLEVILYILEDVTYHAYCKLYLIVRVNLLDFNFLNASFKIYQCKYFFYNLLNSQVLGDQNICQTFVSWLLISIFY